MVFSIFEDTYRYFEDIPGTTAAINKRLGKHISEDALRRLIHEILPAATELGKKIEIASKEEFEGETDDVCARYKLLFDEAIRSIRETFQRSPLTIQEIIRVCEYDSRLTTFATDYVWTHTNLTRIQVRYQIAETQCFDEEEGEPAFLRPDKEDEALYLKAPLRCRLGPTTVAFNRDKRFEVHIADFSNPANVVLSRENATHELLMLQKVTPHENIPKPHVASSDRAPPFLVFPSSHRIFTLPPERDDNVPIIRSFLKDMLATLSHCHTKGVIHRNLVKGSFLSSPSFEAFSLRDFTKASGPRHAVTPNPFSPLPEEIMADELEEKHIINPSEDIYMLALYTLSLFTNGGTASLNLLQVEGDDFERAYQANLAKHLTRHVRDKPLQVLLYNMLALNPSARPSCIEALGADIFSE